MTQLFEQDGHLIGIPDRYFTTETLTALAESGPRVACAIAESDAPFGRNESTLTLHRDVGRSGCRGQVADGRELFGTDYWCVYCGAKFDKS